MWLVIGLGNADEAYVRTRHNTGFMVIDSLSAGLSIPLNRKTKNFRYGRGFIEDEEVLLIKPLTFMNRSGIAVREAAGKFAGEHHLLVIHDDLDLETGVVKIKKTGSSGGHRGVESIIQNLGSKDFIRLKIGIGRSDKVPSEVYVLKPFSNKEKPAITEAIEKAAEAVSMIITHGIAKAQNKFHSSLK